MKLTNQNIANVVEEIEKFFKELNIAKQDIVKVCFLFEESLLSCQEKFGEDHDFEFIKKKWFGTPKVIIRIYGETYNPIADDENKDIVHDIVIKNFLNYEQAGVNYRYEHGCNEISVFSTKKAKKIKIPGGNATIAVFL